MRGKIITKIVWLMLTVMWLLPSPGQADFFEINKIRYHENPPKDDIGVWVLEEISEKDENGNPKKINKFIPCFSVEVEVEKRTKSTGLTTKVYLYKEGEDGHETLIEIPSAAGKPGKFSRRSRMPAIFDTKEEYTLFFAVPEKLRETIKDYALLVVFGDKYQIAAETYPSRAKSPDFFVFDEKEIYENPTKSSLDREEAVNPVSEIVVKTKNPRQPQMTLFLRPPKGMTDFSEAKGILAWCVSANGIDDIRQSLKGLDDQLESSALLAFADKHQLALLAWGGRSIWDPGKNYDEYTEEEYKVLDESFEQVADAWEKGLQEMHEKHGLPEYDIILVGLSASAQWAHRLALKKPQYFHAIQIHTPSSFDRPTTGANRIVWCLTTGELESGYERSKRFFMDCKKLNYPIIYKAYIGLGHASNHPSDIMKMEFLEYALTLLEERHQYEEIMEDRTKPQNFPEGPWPEAFRNPAYIGDIVNQEVFSADQKDMVPEGFQVSVPNKHLADIWSVSSEAQYQEIRAKKKAENKAKKKAENKAKKKAENKAKKKAASSPPKKSK